MTQPIVTNSTTLEGQALELGKKLSDLFPRDGRELTVRKSISLNRSQVRLSFSIPLIQQFKPNGGLLFFSEVLSPGESLGINSDEPFTINGIELIL